MEQAVSRGIMRAGGRQRGRSRPRQPKRPSEQIVPSTSTRGARLKGPFAGIGKELWRLGETTAGRDWAMMRAHPANHEGLICLPIPDNSTQRRMNVFLPDIVDIRPKSFTAGAMTADKLYFSGKAVGGLWFVNTISTEQAAESQRSSNIMFVTTSDPARPILVLQYVTPFPERDPDRYAEAMTMVLTAALTTPWEVAKLIIPSDFGYNLTNSGSPYYCGYLQANGLGSPTAEDAIAGKASAFRISAQSFTGTLVCNSLTNQGTIVAGQMPTQVRIQTDAVVKTRKMMVLANPVPVQVVGTAALVEDSSKNSQQLVGEVRAVTESVKVGDDIQFKEVDTMVTSISDVEMADMVRSVSISTPVAATGIMQPPGPNERVSKVVGAGEAWMATPEQRQPRAQALLYGGGTAYVTKSKDQGSVSKETWPVEELWNYETLKENSLPNLPVYGKPTFQQERALVVSQVKSTTQSFTLLEGVKRTPIMADLVTGVESIEVGLGLQVKTATVYTGDVVEIEVVAAGELISNQVNAVTLPALTTQSLLNVSRSACFNGPAKAGVYMPMRTGETVQPWIAASSRRPTIYSPPHRALEEGEASQPLMTYGQDLMTAASWEQAWLTGVMIWEGISAQASIRLVMRTDLETAPGAGDSWDVMAVDPPPPDQAAIEAVAAITSRMPHAFPSAYNDLGKMLSVVLEAAKKYLVPTVQEVLVEQAAPAAAKHKGWIGTLLSGGVKLASGLLGFL